jgi:hypothetical protein
VLVACLFVAVGFVRRVLLPMSACFLHHDMTVTSALREEQRQRKQQQQQQGADADPSASEQQEQQNTSSSSSSGEAQELIAVSRSLVILHDPDVCRTFAAALHGYCKTALAHLDELAAGSHECSGHSCGHDHEHHHERNVASTLRPLQQVVRWLLFSFDVTVAAAEDDSAFRELKASDTAAAADGAGGDSSSTSSSSGDRLLLSVNKQALQLQAASQAAAGSLVLTILLARATAPVLDWLQTQLKQLPAAAAEEGDVLLPISTAGDVYAGLHFVCAVWQAICSRYALSMLLEEQLKQLLKAAAAAVTASKALGDKVANKRGAAANEQETAAAAEAEQVSKGLRVAASATHAALHGRGLARGWSHLAYVLPSEALIAARDFQTTWPGERAEVIWCGCHCSARWGAPGGCVICCTCCRRRRSLLDATQNPHGRVRGWRVTGVSPGSFPRVEVQDRGEWVARKGSESFDAPTATGGAYCCTRLANHMARSADVNLEGCRRLGAQRCKLWCC